MAEEYFPRGGKKPNVTYFKQSSNFLGAAEKGQGKKKKQKKRSENDDGYLSDEAVKEVDLSYKMCAAGISQKSIKAGVNILGRVRRTLDTKLLVSLPGKIEGAVMACHVSQPYNKQLEAYVNDETEKIRDLADMFRPGQYLALQVLEVDASGEIMLSAMPQHVNGARTHADLKKGDILQAAVSSVEDHGYVMDLGVANVTAFLAKADANPDIELDAGVLIWTCVKSLTAGGDGGVVALSGALTALQKALRRKRGALQPGGAVEFTVEKPLDNGIKGRVFGDTTGYIQRFHADNSKGKKPALGQKLRAYVLYVMPTRNEPFLTTREIFQSSYPDMKEEMVFKDGDIIEEAQVLRIASRSIHFKLARRCVGTMSLKRVAVDEDLSDEQVIAQSYPIGSTHRVRVLTYNMSDYVYHVSDQPAVLAERYFSLEQLPAGARVAATVRARGDRHLAVLVGRLSGVVPQTHLSDAGVYVDPKKATTSNLTKKFKVGQEVQVRVLCCDPARQNLQLTMKPSLLAEDIEVLASYDQAEVGKSYTGFIKVVKDYVLVGFFGSVVAYVPANQVCWPPVENLAESFHPGQIVNCTIMRIDKENKKMGGSLFTAPFWPAEKPPYLGKRKIDTAETEVSETPKKKRKSKDDVPEDTQVSAEPKRKNFLKILKNALQEEGTDGLASYDQAEIGKNYTGFVKVAKDYMLVGFLGGVVAYVPRYFACDPPLEDLSGAFQLGQIVKCTILKCQPEEKKMLGSLTIPPFWPAKQAPDTEKQNEEDGETPKKKKKKDDAEDTDGKKKKDKKNKKVTEVSEESDAIETDIYEDSDQVMTPEDRALIDLSDCETLKQWRKRVASLGKNLKCRLSRIKRVQKKILNIEEKGLTAENKRHHTAMHQEILVIKERIKKLVEALNTAQKKLSKLEKKEGDIEKHKKKMAEFNKLKAMLCKIEPSLKENSKTNKKEEQSEDTVTDENDTDEKPEKTKERKEKVIKDKQVEKTKKPALKEIKVAESLQPALEVPSAKDFWSGNADSLAKTVQEESSSSSEDEEKEQPKKKRKKLSAAEKDAKARAEEERLRELERRAADDSQPRSSDQFERALLASPNCSQLWVAYMAFHLQATEIEKARAVGRRALSTISFREEGEKLNVWLAMLNFEHLFGTKESQQKTLEDALQMNDTFKIHSKLLDILADAGKLQELTSLVDLMMKKYKRDPQCYILCGQACFNAGLGDKARHVMQKAISVLEKKEHVQVLVQFALLERSSGSRERAEALFEQVLAVYPQRVDVGAAYADMLAKAGDMDQLRQVMERMTSHKLPARKIKVLYNKWVELEERAGNTEQAEQVRERALRFIEKAKF